MCVLVWVGVGGWVGGWVGVGVRLCAGVSQLLDILSFSKKEYVQVREPAGSKQSRAPPPRSMQQGQGVKRWHIR